MCDIADSYVMCGMAYLYVRHSASPQILVENYPLGVIVRDYTYIYM